MDGYVVEFLDITIFMRLVIPTLYNSIVIVLEK